MVTVVPEVTTLTHPAKVFWGTVFGAVVQLRGGEDHSGASGVVALAVTVRAPRKLWRGAEVGAAAALAAALAPPPPPRTNLMCRLISGQLAG